MKKIGACFLFLIFFLVSFYPTTISATGIGLQNFKGSVSVMNTTFRGNFTGIQTTTTNAAKSANETIENMWITSNYILDSTRHGMMFDFNSTPSLVTVRNNSLDNTNVPDTGQDTRKGRYGIRILNLQSPSIANNTVRNFGRSGIQLRNIDEITVVNNYLHSNGNQDFMLANEYFGAGIQARDSTFSQVAYNTITSNLFSGIAAYNTGGTIGPDNTIKFDGDPDSTGQIGAGAGINDCVVVGGFGGTFRAGIMVRELTSATDMTVMCTNTIQSNYYQDIVKTGAGTVYSCGNVVIITNFFASEADTVFYFDGSSGHVDLDCSNPQPPFDAPPYSNYISNGVIDAATAKGTPVPFGIIISGPDSDVTVRNCTIRNAAMAEQYRATIENTVENKYLGAGIFIANDAAPSITNNYIYSNGWGLLDDRIYTESGSSGVMMRCANGNASIVNNFIVSNLSDGLVGRQTGGLVGVVNQGNTFRNNARGGIGVAKGTSRNFDIAYNVIHNNQRGIGINLFDGNMMTISNNFIYTNQGSLIFGGVGIYSMTTGIYIKENTIRNNIGSTGGGMGLTASNGTASIVNNVILNNYASIAGGIGMNGLSNANVYVEGNSLANNTGRVGGIGITLVNGTFSINNNEIINNTGSTENAALAHVGGVGFHSPDAQTTIYMENNTLKNNTAMVPGGPDRGRVGGLGINNAAATISLVNNTAANNNAICIGGIGLDLFTGFAFIDGNIIYSNTNDKSKFGAGGLAFDYNYGEITISNNTIFSNTNRATGSGGIGLNLLQAGAKIHLAGNSVYNNVGHRVGGIGIFQPATNDVTIVSNRIFYNAESGLGIWEGSFLNIQDNFIISNGIQDRVIDNFHYASGIQLVDSTFTNSNVSNNIIRSNRYAGIQVFNSPGSIGPNNIIEYNGRGELECSIGGNGRGGVSVRDLSVSNLTVANNTVQYNLIKQRQLRPGSCVLAGEFWYEEPIGGTLENVPCGGTNWTGDQVGVLITPDTVINHSCTNVNELVTNNGVTTIDNCNVVGAPIWGIAVVGDVEVTIKNSNIYNNAITNAGENAGPDNESTGGGVLIAGGANVYMDANNVYANGYIEQAQNEGGYSGVVLRCSGQSTTLVNNTIENNANDGIDIYEGRGYIGLQGQANTIELNDRFGIGLRGGTQLMEIVYNNIGYNDRGIGGTTFNGNLFTIANNIIYSNRNSYTTGGIGLTDFSGTAYISDNTIRNNSAANIGGVGIINSDSTTNIMLVDNIFFNNTAANLGALGLTNANGSISIMNNTIYSNISTGSIGGIGVSDAPASLSLRIEGNSISNNTGAWFAGIGVRRSATTDIDIYSNTISNNTQSGLGVVGSTYFNIQNNFIVSNGMDNLLVDDQFYAAGIQLRDSTFINNNISGNTIRNNYFTGIEAYDTPGYFGPDNVIRYNGNGQLVSLSCGLGGPGSGDGGVAVRGLDVIDTLIVSENWVDNNYYGLVTRRDCGGTVRLDGDDVSCARGAAWDMTDAVVYVAIDGKVYVNAVWYSDTPIIDGLADPANFANISDSSKAWGVAISSGATGVTVRNCNIFGNNGTINDYGPYDSNLGGGVFVGGAAQALIYSNNIYSNGVSGLGGKGPDDFFGLGGHVGVVFACDDIDTTLRNNTIYGNMLDGVDIRGGSPVIGVPGAPNTIFNNGRHGIGNSTVAAPVIDYNSIYNNARHGIGVTDNATPTIRNNIIYSHDEYQKSAGVAMIDLASPYVYSNTIYSNEVGIGFGRGESARENLLGDQTLLNLDQVKLDTGATTANDYYNGMLLILDNSSVGSPKDVLISYYDGGSKIATINMDWATLPNQNDGYTIFNLGFSGTAVVEKNSIYNSAQAGVGMWGMSGADVTITYNNIYDNASVTFGGIGATFNNNSAITIDNNIKVDEIAFNYNSNTPILVINNYITEYGLRAQFNTGGIYVSGNTYLQNADLWSNTGDIIFSNNTEVIEIIAKTNNGGEFLIDNNTKIGIGLMGGNDMDFSVTNNSLVNINTTVGSGWSGADPGGTVNVPFSVEVRGNSFVNGELWCRKTHRVLIADNTTINANLHFDQIDKNWSGGFPDPVPAYTWEGIQLLNNQTINGYVSVKNSEALYILDNPSFDNYISIQNIINYAGTSGPVSIANNSISASEINIDNVEQLDVTNNNASTPLYVRVGVNTTGINITDNPLIQGVSLNNNGYSVIPQISGNTITGASIPGISVTLGGVSITDNTIYNNTGGIRIARAHASVQVTISGNTVYSNTNTGMGMGGVGGIGLLDVSGTASVANNRIYSNVGDLVGGIGATASNGSFSFINNQITNNIGSSADINLSNVGGMGLRELASGATVYVEGNTLRNNKAVLTLGNTRARVGAIGVSASNAAISIVNNTIDNNAGTSIGGIGFDSFGVVDNTATVFLSGNFIYSNTGNNSNLGAGGAAFDYTYGKLTISNNSIYNNTNQATGVGGLGLSNVLASASVLIEKNIIYSNSGLKAAGMGITNANTTDVTIFSNAVFNNLQSGIGIFTAHYLTVRNNFIVSNGVEDMQVDNERYGFGIQLRDATYAFNNISSNIIRHNRFAGVGAYAVTGTIGPNNTVVNNGKQDQSISCGVLTNGYGGFAGRNLGSSGMGGMGGMDGTGDTLYLLDSLGAVFDENTNLYTNNYEKQVVLKPGAGGGNLTYNNRSIEDIWLGPSDSLYYFDGVSGTTTDNVNCAGGTIDATGYAYGIIVIGDNADVEIQNCTIKNAGATYADLQKISATDALGGAGILVAANAKVNIHDNYIDDNGFDMSRGRITNYNGGDPALDNILYYHWAGGGATDEMGVNQLWVQIAGLTAGQQKTLYFYSGNPSVTTTSVDERVTQTYFKINEKHTESGLLSYWKLDANLNDSGPNVYNGSAGLASGSENPAAIIYYNNDYRFVKGGIWQNQRNGYGEPTMKSLRTEENFGEDTYVLIGSPSSNLDLTGDQSIVFWFSPIDNGPMYARETTTTGKEGTGGVEVSILDNGRAKFKIASLDDTVVYSCVSPEDTFEYGELARAEATMVAAIYDYDASGNGKMELYILGQDDDDVMNSLVATNYQVPAGFSPGYDTNSKSYLAAADLDNDGSIGVGETYLGLLDEVVVFNEVLTEKRIEALHYHREYDASVEGPGWPTVTVGAAESGNYTLADATTWPTRWPITIDNVTANLTDFQVGPALLSSPDSGGLLMRCVDENSTVANNTFNNNRRDGVSVYSMNGTSIGNNTSWYNERFGIAMRETIENATIDNNYIYQNDRGIGGFDVRKGSGQFSIVNNHINDNDLISVQDKQGWKAENIGFTFSNQWVYIGYNTIENGIHGIGWQGAPSGGGGDVTIEYNTIQNHRGNPILFEKWEPGNKLQIKNNWILGNKNPMKMRYMAYNNVTIENNMVDGKKTNGANFNINHGFQCITCGYITIKNNTFQNMGWHNKGADTFAAIRFELQDAGSGMVIDSNTIQNNAMNGITFQDISGLNESISITNNYLTNNGCRRVGKKTTTYGTGCQQTSTPDGTRHFTIRNLSALQFRDVDNLGYVYIADNTIHSNYIDGIKFERNDYSNVTLENNTITSNVSWFLGSTAVNDSDILQATNTTVTTGNISSVTTILYDGGLTTIDNVTLTNDAGFPAAGDYIGLNLITGGTPTDVEIYSYDTSNKIAWISYDSGGESYTTFSNKPTDNSAYTMDDPYFTYIDPGIITLANTANASDGYYDNLMITISNFASAVDVAASQPGDNNQLTLGNNANGVTDNFYTGYHLIDADADLEYNIINSYEAVTKIAYMNQDYETKPAGTCDIGYPIKYILDYNGTTKNVEVAGNYPKVPTGGQTYTITGGVSASSGYVDGSAMQFRDIIEGTLLIKNTTVRNNWRGIWFNHIPNTNNNFSNPNVLLQGNIIEYNMGIGVRVDEVANVVFGDPGYSPNVYWTGGCGKSAGWYSKMNGMRGEPGLFIRSDGGNSSCRGPKRDLFVNDAIANGGTSVFKNGSWGVQLRGWGDYGYETNIWFNGGQFRGNKSQGIGTQGSMANVSIYNAFFGGNADAVGVRLNGNIIFNNSVAMGNDAVHANWGGKAIVENYSYIHTFFQNRGKTAELTSHSYVGCMQRCGIWIHGPGGGDADISDYGYIETGRFIGGGPTFHDHGGFGMLAGEHSTHILAYDGAFGNCYGGRRNGHKFWGYQSLSSTANPHPNNFNGLGTCQPVAEASTIWGNNVYGGIGYGRYGHDIGWNYVTGSISPAAGDSGAYIHDNWSGDPAINAIDCNHPGTCVPSGYPAPNPKCP